MATVVLVPGAWLPGRAWDAVAAALRARGHAVHPITLPGMEGREREIDRETTAASYVADIVLYLESHHLGDVTLVGHSYACGLIAPVAARYPGVVRLVYVDSGPNAPGANYVDNESPETQELLASLVETRGDGWLLPMPSFDQLEGALQAPIAGIDEAGLNAMIGMARPMPYRTWTEPVAAPYAPDPPLPSVYITSSFPLDDIRQLLQDTHPWVSAVAGPEWSFLEVTTGHWPMLSKPQELAEAIDTAITGAA